MTTQIQRRRGTATEHAAFTGAPGEITVDTTNWRPVVHDGATPGGHPVATEESVLEAIQAQVLDAADDLQVTATGGAAARTLADWTGLVKDLNPGPTAAVAGSVMAVDLLWEPEDASPSLVDEAGIWPNETYAGFGFSKSFGADEGGGPSPASCLFAFAVANGSDSDVVAVLGDALANANDSIVFGGNVIARTSSGLTGVKLVGFEIDVEPAAGVTLAAGSGGLYINIFNSACPGAAIQVGQLGGGSFANGLVLGGLASAGAGVSPQSGATMGSLINTGVATYSNDAIIVSNQHKLRLSGTASTHGKMWMDSSNNIRLVLGSGGFFVRNSADTTSQFGFSANGNLDIAGDLLRGGTKIVGARKTGWTAATGTATRATFDTSTVTTAELAERVKALIDDLHATGGHGLIGA